MKRLSRRWVISLTTIHAPGVWIILRPHITGEIRSALIYIVTNVFLVSKETVVLRRWESKTNFFFLIQRLIYEMLFIKNKKLTLSTQSDSIHYFPLVHNALCLPPKFCINYSCEILLGGLHIPKSIPQQ